MKPMAARAEPEVTAGKATLKMGEAVKELTRFVPVYTLILST